MQRGWQVTVWWAAMALAPVLFLAGCDDGCRARTLSRAVIGADPEGAGAIARPVTDCPDGLARCEEGRVWVSRLATLSLPCAGSPEACRCPWEAIAQCSSGCVADGVLAVMERAPAAAQLCAPATGAAAFVRPVPADSRAQGGCDEGVAYRCSDSVVIDCAAGRVAGTCLRGCAAADSSLDLGEGLKREAAFAILCSR